MSKNRPRILITGGAGYIGDAVASWLSSMNVEPHVLDTLIYGGSYMRNIRFHGIDIRDRQKMRNLMLNDGGFDAVVHLAAIVGDGACAVNPEETIEVNEEGTKIVADLCQETNARMIFASTCSVYGANNDILDERSPTNPLSLYAGTKLNAENYIKNNVDNYVIFRLGTLFGMSTEHARIRCDLVANILTYKAVLGHTLPVFGGSQWRPMLHVKDAALAFAKAADNKHHFSGTYILSRENITIAQLAYTIVKQVGSGEIEMTEQRFEDLRNYKVDNSKSKNAHFYTSFSIEHGVKEMAEAIRSGRIANVWDERFHNAKYIRSKHEA